MIKNKEISSIHVYCGKVAVYRQAIKPTVNYYSNISHSTERRLINLIRYYRTWLNNRNDNTSLIIENRKG